MRPKQWIKNCFIFLPLLFSKKILYLNDNINALIAFAVFCMFSGAVYLLNDTIDCEKDKLHHKKCHRPIPSGKLSVKSAWSGIYFIILTGSLIALSISKVLLITVSVYFFMNIAYSLNLKKLVILDVICIAVGFTLRVLAGAAAISVAPSHWLLMCAFLISLFLGFCKRRAEIITLSSKANEHREVLEHYTVAFLDQMIVISTSATIMSYALYTMSSETVKKFNTENLIYTVPFVIYGIFRYLYLVHKKAGGGSPTEAVLTDMPIILCVISWAAISGMIIFQLI